MKTAPAVELEQETILPQFNSARLQTVFDVSDPTPDSLQPIKLLGQMLPLLFAKPANVDRLTPQLCKLFS
jgi:hypothetical protein